jgi:hypothetical protein
MTDFEKCKDPSCPLVGSRHAHKAGHAAAKRQKLLEQFEKGLTALDKHLRIARKQYGVLKMAYEQLKDQA